MTSSATKRFFQNRGKVETAKKKAVKQLKAKDGQYFGRLMKIGNTDKDGPTKFYATVVLICDKNGDDSCSGEQGTSSTIIQDSKPDAKNPYTEADQMARVMELWDRLGYDQFPQNEEEMDADMAELNKVRPYVRVGISTGANGGKYLNINGLAEKDDILELNSEIELPGEDGGETDEEEETEEGGDEATDGGEGGEEGGEEGDEGESQEEEAAEEEPAKPAPKKTTPAPKTGGTSSQPAPKSPSKAPAKPAAAEPTSRRRR